jgi:hypothetical protein
LNLPRTLRKDVICFINRRAGRFPGTTTFCTAESWSMVVDQWDRFQGGGMDGRCAANYQTMDAPERDQLEGAPPAEKG